MYTLNNTKSAYAGSKKWIAYEPKSVNSKVIAVGSNMKFFRYKEIDFWLGITTSINAPYNVQKSLSKHGIENQISKNALMWTMNAESQLCQNSSAADLVILDGSIHSKISKIKTVFSTQRHCLEFLKTMYPGENIVFISIMPPLEIISDPYGIASIMRCAIANKCAGFGHVYEDIQYDSDLVISTTYASLVDWAMMLKIEMFGTRHDNNRMKSILNHLYTGDLMGYPNLIHAVRNMCIIDDSSLPHSGQFWKKPILKWTVT